MDSKKTTSPSGKYTLTTTSINRRPGAWNYTRGVITETATGRVIAEVKRNYPSFPNLFVEGHPNGHDYLVCGENYQGQTVIELDTGERRDFLPDTAAKGRGFCWSRYKFEPVTKMLVVDGCYWAAPYEMRFYDFTDPMEKGWPELPLPHCIDADYADNSPNPILHEDGSVTCTASRDVSGEDEEEDRYEVFERTRVRRDGDKMVIVEEWVDPAELARRAEWKRRQEEWDRAWAEYKATDPVYLLFKQLTPKEIFPTSDEYVGVGQTYDGWDPKRKWSDTRISSRLAKDQVLGNGLKASVEIEWGRKEAPIRLALWAEGQGPQVLWWDRSEENMREAITAARTFLAGAMPASG